MYPAQKHGNGNKVSNEISFITLAVGLIVESPWYHLNKIYKTVTAHM